MTETILPRRSGLIETPSCFKSALVAQGPAEPLSNAGQDALGALIKRLAGEN